MSTATHALYWLAAFIVLAEALNKLERTSPFAPGLARHDRLVDGLKALAWSLLAMGGAGAFFGPLMAGAGFHGEIVRALCEPDPHDAAIMFGFAILIIRTRVKEG